jgi:hypothetical protein
MSGAGRTPATSNGNEFRLAVADFAHHGLLVANACRSANGRVQFSPRLVREHANDHETL